MDSAGGDRDFVGEFRPGLTHVAGDGSGTVVPGARRPIPIELVEKTRIRSCKAGYSLRSGNHIGSCGPSFALMVRIITRHSAAARVCDQRERNARGALQHLHACTNCSVARYAAPSLADPSRSYDRGLGSACAWTSEPEEQAFASD